jgi:CubicO group peptidase (beta-lactamase class C family)
MHPLTSRFHRLLYVNVSLYLLLTLLLAACGTATPSTSPSPSQTMISHVDHLLTTEVQDANFSGSVLIARGGKVLFSKGYSLADWQQHLPNTPHTKFHVASLTKQFTAMAILLLQEQGKLHVQDHACTYVLDCPLAWQPITIHQLLTHTSGIPTLINPPTTLPSSPQQFIALSKNTPLDFPVGTQFSYSNMGYQLLGYIIQQVSGEPYAAFVQHSIFAPLQMRETDFDPAYPSRPDQATGYVEWQMPATPASLISLSRVAGLISLCRVAGLFCWPQVAWTPPSKTSIAGIRRSTRTPWSQHSHWSRCLPHTSPPVLHQEGCAQHHRHLPRMGMGG